MHSGMSCNGGLIAAAERGGLAGLAPLSALRPKATRISSSRCKIRLSDGTGWARSWPPG
jgi:hypothetical protein